MRGLTIILAVMTAFSVSVFAQSNKKSGDYQMVDLIANKVVTVEGSLKNGKLMSDLGWASRSSTACFPSTQNAKFNGNHVLFVTQMPARSILKVTVKPKNSNANLSIYGYQLAVGDVVLPLNLQSCVTCEAEHKWDYPKRGKTQDDSRIISLNTVGVGYSVIIGVAGANGLTDADFTLEFSLEK
ncbi:MAG: hypothetical protein K1X72_17740 [Pyrinomonadaceae bacterium]|nr:hypothetical protein [Pyrinomonadaceae bacterium]